MATHTRTPELAMPAAALTELRNALVSSVGAEAAADALRAAGHAAGEAFNATLSEGGATAELSAERFWARLASLFSARGWGQLRYSEAHPGVGSLEAFDWAESQPDDAAEQPSCHFTTGALANVLGKAAGADVAVMEVECRGRGDDRCRFLFGGSEAVYAVYEHLASGEAPDSAIARIG
jgi:predicted hydrocarbon binding protein